MKNILVFNNTFFPISTTFIYRQILGALRENKVFLLAFNYSNADKFPLDGAVQKMVIKPYYGLFDRTILFLLRRSTGTDYKFSLQGLKRFKRIVKQNNIEIIHVHYGTWGVHILPIARKLNIPLIVSFHGYDASVALKRKSYTSKLSDLFDYASRIIIVSQHMYAALNLSAWQNKVSLIPYGVDIHEFKGSGRLNTTDHIKILHSGRLTPKKGVPDLISVFVQLAKKYDTVSLHILGDGVEKGKCYQLVQESKMIHRVHFYGSKSQAEVIKLMDECHIFVLNSRTSDDGDMEGLPNAILEAMSMGMAVVSTYHAGIPTAVENGVSGILVPEKDNQSLFSALSKLLEDPGLIERFGANASHRIEEYFTIDKMQNSINSVYEEIKAVN